MIIAKSTKIISLLLIVALFQILFLKVKCLDMRKAHLPEQVTLKKGKFELADKGTIFLDEIGNLPLKYAGKIAKGFGGKTNNKNRRAEDYSRKFQVDSCQ